MSGWDLKLAKLTASVKCRAALYGLDASQWAGVSQVKATNLEIRTIITDFSSSDSLFRSPPTVEGERL